MKRCSKCGQILPLSEFCAHRGMADGHINFCKKCECDKARAYRQAHPEECRAAQHSWREAHPEECRAYQRTYRKEHHEEILAQDRASWRAYYAKKPEKCRARSRAWRQAHPEKVHAYHRVYRPVSYELRLCAFCGQLFKPSRKDKRFCSQQCHDKAYNRSVLKICEECGKEFWGHPKGRFCNKKCSARFNRRMSGMGLTVRICRYCLKEFQPQYGQQVYCSPRCRNARHSQLSHYRRRATGTDDITIPMLHRRDNGKCAICGKHVSLAKKNPHRLSASIDHIIPVSRGGEHKWRNVQLAHMACNSVKHTSIEGQQLRIF